MLPDLRMKERTGSIMFMTVIVSLTMCPAWTAESSGSTGASASASSSVQAVEAVPYLSVEKRAQLGFQGMRGKKDSYDLVSNPKRASLGFHGMRGKKWLDVDQDFEDELMEKRAAMGFHGMRGKKNEQTYQGLLLPNYLIFDENENQLEKRASLSGFHGMRGKKDVELSKRAQQGFLGMRGKKNYDQDDDDDDEDVFGAGAVGKRAMGFHGMRGKKLNDLGFKRAQQGFLGMRGKKNLLASSSLTSSSAVDENEPPNELIRSQGDNTELDDLLAYLTDSTASQMRFRRATPQSKTEQNGLLPTAE